MVLQKTCKIIVGGKRFAMTYKLLTFFRPICTKNVFLANNNVVYSTKYNILIYYNFYSIGTTPNILQTYQTLTTLTTLVVKICFRLIGMLIINYPF